MSVTNYGVVRCSYVTPTKKNSHKSQIVKLELLNTSETGNSDHSNDVKNCLSMWNDSGYRNRLR